jgi:hypothetical protein
VRQIFNTTSYDKAVIKAYAVFFAFMRIIRDSG